MKIILIEDDPKIAYAIAQGLGREKFVIEVCHDGDLGLNLALSGDGNLLIIDWLLPGINGLEICQRVRAAGIKTPIIMLTVKNNVDSRIEGLNAGADDYLIKPFSFDELLARVRALLRRSGPTAQSVLQIDDYSIRMGMHQ